MEILVIGTSTQLEETREKFGGSHHYTQSGRGQDAVKLLDLCDVVFDFTIDDPAQARVYGQTSSCILFLNVSTISLSELNLADHLVAFGFCGMPTFLNREILETSLRSESDRKALEEICGRLKTEFLVVTDRVGLVTPRVICMIINEAYLTAEEGTASRSDIDIAMKLGTNYPWGPFEWCERIGVQDVCKLLQAVLKDSKDVRYKLSPLLESEQKVS